MSRIVRLAFGGAALLSILGWSGGCGMPPPIRVMSFNIRYATAADGENRWERRAELVFETVRAYQPDILGLQEVLAFQAQALRRALRDYEFVGVGRDDGAAAGEFAPILYRKEVFDLIQQGHFWLSEQPQQPGSLGWDAALPRIATWVRLRYRSHPVNQIYLINTHLDHRGARARVASAKLIRRLVETMAGTPIIVTGDFNAAPGAEVHQTLTAAGGNLAELRDSYAAVGGDESRAGTFHGFRGQRAGRRIDWILHNRRFETLEAGVDRSSQAGRYPSDHFPVTATLRLIRATRWGWL